MVEGARVRQPVGDVARPPPGDRVPADVRNLQARARRAPRSGPAAADPLRPTVLGAALVEQLHAEADAEDRHAGVAALAQQPVEAELAYRRHRRRKRADARQDDTVRGSHDVVLAGDRRAGADMLEGLLGRAQVAHAVVEDRDRRPGAHSSPFVEGMPCSSGSIETASRSARAKALNAASTMWWVFVATLDGDVQRQLRRVGDGAKELLGEVGVEVGDRLGRQIGLEGRERATGEVERAARARLVHRHDGVAVAADPAAVAERLVERAPEREAGVLDGVVRPGLEVALDLDVEVEPTVAGDRVEQVVEEPDAGGARARAVAVEQQRQLDVGLLGAA